MVGVPLCSHYFIIFCLNCQISRIAKTQISETGIHSSRFIKDRKIPGADEMAGQERPSRGTEGILLRKLPKDSSNFLGKANGNSKFSIRK